MKKVLMELLGTFFFVLTIAMTGNPFAIAAMLMAWVYIGGYVSGAHYNPMVTLAVALRGRLAWHLAPWYMAAQVLGATCAFAMTKFIIGSVTLPMPNQAIMLSQAFLIEALLAFVLACVVLVVATSEKFKSSHVFGFAIGFTIPALAALGSETSGGLFNPAIALGAHIMAMLNHMPIAMEYTAMYVVGAFLGGAAAAYAFKFFHE